MKKIQARFTFVVLNDDKRSEADECTIEHITNFPSDVPELKSELSELVLENCVKEGWISSNGNPPKVSIVSPIEIIKDGQVVEN